MRVARCRSMIKPIVLLALITTSSSAQADQDQQDQPILSYRTELALADAVTVTFLAAAAATESGTLGAIGALSYVTGPFLIHTRQGNRQSSVFSPILRVGAPALGTLLGIAITDCATDIGIGSDSCDPGLTLAGLALGTVLGIGLDYMLLAKHPAKEERSYAVQPIFTPVERGGTLGLAGAW